MAHCVDPAADGPIIELGPGTGPVTQALLARGVAPERLVLVEFEPSFCHLLAHKFPRRESRARRRLPAGRHVSPAPWTAPPGRHRLQPAAAHQAGGRAPRAAAAGFGPDGPGRALHPVHLWREIAGPDPSRRRACISGARRWRRSGSTFRPRAFTSIGTPIAPCVRAADGRDRQAACASRAGSAAKSATSWRKRARASSCKGDESRRSSPNTRRF